MFFFDSLTFYFLLFSVRLPNISHTSVIYSFLTLNLCQLPITFSTSKFHKVIINSYLLPHHCSLPRPTTPNGSQQAFWAILPTCGPFGCHNNWDQEGRYLVDEGTIDPRSPNMYETTLYNKELSASLKTLRRCQTLSRDDRSLWAGVVPNVVRKGIKRPCLQPFSISPILLTHNLREPYNGLTHHSLA